MCVAQKLRKLYAMAKEKTERLFLVVSPEEKALFGRASREVGLSLSSWIRAIALAEAKKVLVTKDDTRPTV